jgi:hypothetical protein
LQGWRGLGCAGAAALAFLAAGGSIGWEGNPSGQRDTPGTSAAHRASGSLPLELIPTA